MREAAAHSSVAKLFLYDCRRAICGSCKRMRPDSKASIVCIGVPFVPIVMTPHLKDMCRILPKDIAIPIKQANVNKACPKMIDQV